jgi:hypothetical protein
VKITHPGKISAASSSTDREPSRFAAVTTAPGFSSLSSTPACSYVLRTGTVRGPIRSLMQPCGKIGRALGGEGRRMKSHPKATPKLPQSHAAARAAGAPACSRLKPFDVHGDANGLKPHPKPAANRRSGGRSPDANAVLAVHNRLRTRPSPRDAASGWPKAGRGEVHAKPPQCFAAHEGHEPGRPRSRASDSPALHSEMGQPGRLPYFAVQREGRARGLKAVERCDKVRPVSWSITGLEFVYAII